MENKNAYWKANLQIIGICLFIWFLVSFVFAILLVEQLNHFAIGGYKLGFWFSQQGSIYVFVALIFFYSWQMNRIDHKFGVYEDE